MEDYFLILTIVSIIVLASFISWIKALISDSKKYQRLKPQLDNLQSLIRQHELKVENDRQTWIKRTEAWNSKIKQDKEALDKIAAQKSMGFPWLAEAFAEYFSLKDLGLEKYLNTKKHPAYTSAKIVREVKNEKKLLRRENKILSYKINYFEKLFPWLTELIAESEEEEIPVNLNSESDDDNNNEDRVKDFIPLEEYKTLPPVIRNQKALDRYLASRNKSKWALGRDYEMYVGHFYSQQGYSIEYKGIIDGFDDLGRDIIATKENQVCIIQCKNWASYKTIHEKHIFQLFGTTMEYWIQKFQNSKHPKTFEQFSKFLNESKLRPIFFTSTTLSERAKQMAGALSIEVIEKKPMGDFPRIKCNIAGRDNEKIYHLPFDQQYDSTIIDKTKGEFFAFTVKEAEDAGFRRAFKHRY